MARDSHGKNRRGKWSTLGIRHLHGEGRVGAATIGLVTKGMIPNGVILVAGRARATREDIAMQSPWTRLGRSPTIRNRVRYTRKKLLQDWSKDWKAWKDEGAWKRGSSSSPNRGFGGTFECESTTVKPRIFSQVGAGSAADAAPRKTVGSLALLHLILGVKGCIRLPCQLSVGLGCEALVRTVFMPVPEP